MRINIKKKKLFNKERLVKVVKWHVVWLPKNILITDICFLKKRIEKSLEFILKMIKNLNIPYMNILFLYLKKKNVWWDQQKRKIVSESLDFDEKLWSWPFFFTCTNETFTTRPVILMKGEEENTFQLCESKYGPFWFHVDFNTKPYCLFVHFKSQEL